MTKQEIIELTNRVPIVYVEDFSHNPGSPIFYCILDSCGETQTALIRSFRFEEIEDYLSKSVFRGIEYRKQRNRDIKGILSWTFEGAKFKVLVVKCCDQENKKKFEQMRPKG
jgi:hypothetical protein